MRTRKTHHHLVRSIARAAMSWERTKDSRTPGAINYLLLENELGLVGWLVVIATEVRIKQTRKEGTKPEMKEQKKRKNKNI